ncbi:MAG: toxin-antitoxin system, antitoxin component [Candidatus Hydrogenedentota bacterium]
MNRQNPRINVVVERPLYKTIKILANRDNVSLSQKIRDLVLEALEYLEDASLTKIAENRERTFTHRRALPSKNMLK